MDRETTRDRALGALTGLAIGDALGMPTQLMSRLAVERQFGAITDFEAAAPDHPIAAALPAASITDDTEQALLVAGLLIAGHGHVAPGEVAQALVAWEDRMRARGSLDLLGPSTTRAVQAILAGESAEEAGRYGTTNGAAMRIAPVGIVVASSDLDALVDRVVEVSSASHNTSIAIAGAAAVAAAVSSAIDGEPWAGVVSCAIAAAAQGSQRGHWVAGGDVGSRIRLAVQLADPAHVDKSLDDIYSLIGTSLATQESVPAAFGILATFPGDPWSAMCAAATLGGDSDTIAALIGAIGGALAGARALPAGAVERVIEVNSLELGRIVDDLLALR
jgi:ADP-ribosylglycohydrolase